MVRIGTDLLMEQKQSRRQANGRQRFIAIAVFSAFAFLILWTIHLATEKKQNSARKISPNSAISARAGIIDRHGEILAENTFSYDLNLNANKLAHPDQAAACIHAVFPEFSVYALLEKIKTRGGDITIKKNIGKDKAEQIDRECVVQETKNGKIRTRRIDHINIIKTQKRAYPKHNSLSHILGFANSVGGVQGLEQLADERLRSSAEPLKISIDAKIQSVVWLALQSAMTEYRAKSASGILMNSRTGEILAIASLPDFDPENIGGYPESNRRFRAIRDNYEMGSIFKIFNTALALESGIPLSKTFNVSRPFVVGGKPIREARGFKPPAANLNLAQIMQYSCNSGSAQMALSLPDGAQADFFRKLHFDSALNTNFGRTERPLFPKSGTPTDRSRWAFGQGISISPLHLLLAANAIVNDGNYVAPTIFPRDFVPNTEYIISPETSKIIRQILYTTKDTSAKQAANQIQGVNIGSKTSTAQKPVNGKYGNAEITAYFVAFPIEAPKYSLLVLLDEPQGANRTSAFNAVPTAGKIIDAIIPLLP